MHIIRVLKNMKEVYFYINICKHIASYSDKYRGRSFTIDINECESQPCQNNGTCTDMINDYHCNCTDGFDGKTCTNSEF